MAESLAIIGLASNIVQFVDFGYRLFSQSKRLYQSSQNSEAAELENIARSFRRLSTSLIHESPYEIRPSSESEVVESDLLPDLPSADPVDASHISQDEVNLLGIATGCKDIANELLSALDKLKINGRRKKWQCFRVALKRVWDPKQIDNIAERMERYGNQLMICLLKVLRYGQHVF